MQSLFDKPWNHMFLAMILMIGSIPLILGRGGGSEFDCRSSVTIAGRSWDYLAPILVHDYDVLDNADFRDYYFETCDSRTFRLLDSLVRNIDTSRVLDSNADPYWADARTVLVIRGSDGVADTAVFTFGPRLYFKGGLYRADTVLLRTLNAILEHNPVNE